MKIKASKTLALAGALTLASGGFAAAAYADYVDAIIVGTSVHAPCGYNMPTQATAPGGSLSFTIGNCHTYAVNRQVVFANGSKGACTTYPQHGALYNYTHGSAYDHLDAC